MQSRTFQSLKKYFEILGIVIGLTTVKNAVFAQVLPENPCCSDPKNYIPDEPAFAPLMRVRVCLHIFQQADGTGNFTEKDYNFIYRVFNDAAGRFGGLCKMKLPTSSAYIPDSRIRLSLDTADIFFRRDTLGWNLYSNNILGKRVNKIETLYNKYVEKDSLAPKNAIHVFWGEGYSGPTDKVSSQGVASGIASGRWIGQPNVFVFAGLGNHWIPGGTLAHEFGHCFGLYHTVERGAKYPTNDQCADTPTYPENPACWNGDTCSNNMMDYNANQCALTACQLGRMRYYLSGLGGDVYKVVWPDWETYRPEATVTIPAGAKQAWKSRKFLSGDLILKRGAELRIFCKTHLPVGANIVLYPGARLIIDGGALYNTKGEKWDVFRLISTRGRNKAVQVINGGKITITDLPRERNYKRYSDGRWRIK